MVLYLEHKKVIIKNVGHKAHTDSDIYIYIPSKKIVFVGDGADKCKGLLESNSQSIFPEEFLPSAAFMAPLAEKKFNNSEFEDTAYFEPFYLKDFVAGIPRIKGLRD